MISIVENLFFKTPEEKARIAQAKKQEEHYRNSIKIALSDYYKEHPDFKNMDPGTHEYVVNKTADGLYKNSNMEKHVEAIRKGEKFNWPK